MKEITLEKAVDELVNNGGHVLTRHDGLIDMFIDVHHSLIVDEHDYEEEGFSHGYYIPYYKQWLLENAKLRTI